MSAAAVRDNLAALGIMKPPGSDDDDDDEAEARDAHPSAPPASPQRSQLDDDEDDDDDLAPSAAASAAAASATAALDAPAPYTELPYDRTERMPFGDFCNWLDQVSNARGRSGSAFSKSDTIFKVRRIQLKSGAKVDLREYLKGYSWWPLLRLFFPEADRTRPNYRVKEKHLAQIVSDVLALDKNGNEAKRLAKPNDAKLAREVSATGVAGVFPDVLFNVLVEGSTRWSATAHSKLLIKDVNTFLDRLAAAAIQADKSVSALFEQKKLFQDLVLRMQPAANEFKWLACIILKDMKLGLKIESTLKAFHPDAFEAFSVNGDLRRITAELADVNKRVEFQVSLFETLRPMLSKKPQLVSKAAAGLGDEFAIEDKLDGERIIMHFDKSADKLKLVSRELKDFAFMYGVGNNRPILMNAMVGMTKGIVDGEMLAYDSTTKSFVPFGSNKTVGKDFRENASSTRWPCFVAFDILLKDDELLTGRPFRERRALLEKHVRINAHHVELVPIAFVNDAPESDVAGRHRIVMAALEDAMAHDKEGLILKSPSSPYVPGEAGRNKGYWVKVKPDYINGLASELDVIVLGGYLPDGTRRMGSGMAPEPSGFLLGLAERPRPGEEPSAFVQFAKVGSGYDDRELAQLRDHLRPHAQVWSRSNLPPHFSATFKKSEDVPYFWYPPEHSVLLEVQAHEIVEAETVNAGFTLRFPRVVRARYDKPWYECERAATVAEWVERGRKGLYTKHKASDLSMDEVNKHKKQQRKQASSSAQIAKVLARAGPQRPTGPVAVESQLLRGKRFAVTRGVYRWPDGTQSKEDAVVSTVLRHGGEVGKGPRQASDIVLCGPPELNAGNNEVKRLLAPSQTLTDVFSLDYLTALVDTNAPWSSPPLFSHYYATSKRARATMELDRFGDHVWQDTNANLLLYSLEQAKSGSAAAPAAAAATSLMVGEDIGLPLWGAFLHFLPAPEDEADAWELLKVEARFAGAVVQLTVAEGVTHIVAHSTAQPERDKVRRMVAAWRMAKADEGFKEPRWVTPGWVRSVLSAPKGQTWVQVAGEERFQVP